MTDRVGEDDFERFIGAIVPAVAGVLEVPVEMLRMPSADRARTRLDVFFTLKGDEK